MVTLFRLTWAVPDFILIVAANLHFAKMNVQSGQSNTQSGHNVQLVPN